MNLQNKFSQRCFVSLVSAASVAQPLLASSVSQFSQFSQFSQRGLCLVSLVSAASVAQPLQPSQEHVCGPSCPRAAASSQMPAALAAIALSDD
jgi:hypothetical protein